MVTLPRIRHLLDEQRRLLLEQLDAVDRAIAALDSVRLDSVSTAPETPPVEADAPGETAAPEVVARRVTPRRVLSDSHKQALVHGNRKAREARDAAKGLAREMPDDSFVPAIGTRAHRASPRLVKRPAKTPHDV